MVRPVAEVLGRVAIPVDQFPSESTHQHLVELVLRDQSATTAVVYLAGGEPTISDAELRPDSLDLVGEHGSDLTQGRVADRATECPSPHAGFHGGEIEIFDHDLAVGVHQPTRELVVGLQAQVDAPAIEMGELGFRRPMTARSGDAPAKLLPRPAPLSQAGSQGRGVGEDGDDALGVSDGGEISHPEIDSGSRPRPHRSPGRTHDLGPHRIVHRHEQPSPSLGKSHGDQPGVALGKVALDPAGVLL